MIALFRRHLYHQRLLLPGLCLGLVLFQVVLIHIAAAFELGPGLQNMMEMLPGLLRNLVQARVQEASFPAAVAFGYAHPAVLVALLGHALLCGTLLAADREQGVLELLVSRPVPRSRHVLAALLLAVLGALLLAGAMMLGTLVGLHLEEAPNERPWTDYLPCAVGLLLLSLAVSAVTLLASAGNRRRGPVLARLLFALVTLYAIEYAADVFRPLAALSWLSPFHYFHPVKVLAGIAERGPYADGAVLAGVSVVASALALLRFERADL